MYILFEVEYPEGAVARSAVENAWTGAGLPQPVPVLANANATPEDVKALVDRVLATSGATKAGTGNGDLEVPRSSRPVLERLEDFYHRLYPETKASPARGHFHYEELEWLGEF